jgi:hypothetical protein
MNHKTTCEKRQKNDIGLSSQQQNMLHKSESCCFMPEPVRGITR